MIEPADGSCPEPLRQAFLFLLEASLVAIRDDPRDAKFVAAQAEHVHNIPAMLRSYRPQNLRFYREVERPAFLDALEAAGVRPSGMMREAWNDIEPHYRRLGASTPG